MPITLTIWPGRVQVNECFKMVEHDDVHVWTCDLRTKYADVNHIAYGEDGHIQVVLGTTPDTLRADGPEGETVLMINGLAPDNWHVSAEVSRYTATVVIYQIKPKVEADGEIQ